MLIDFIKMHGNGNDFVIIEIEDNKIFTPGLIQKLSDRNKAIGFDQFILLKPSMNADIFMDIYNQDGSSAGACGNAARCVTMLMAKKLGKQDIKIELKDRIIEGKYIGQDNIAVNMGQISFDEKLIGIKGDLLQLNNDFSKIYGTAYIGNPHLVFFVEHFELDLEKHGKYFSELDLFENQINVSFAKIIDENNVELRVYERGAGLTLACGSAACACYAVLKEKNLGARSAVTIRQLGGELVISSLGEDIIMQGSARESFKGRIEIENYV